MGEDYENEIRQELRWVKDKYEMQLTEEHREQKLVVTHKHSANDAQVISNFNPRNTFDDILGSTS